VIKFVGTANPITNFKFAEEYVENNKQNKYLIFIFLAHPIPNLDYVSHTRFNCVVIAKPSNYLYYLEQYASAAYLATYLDFLVVTQSMAVIESTSESVIESVSDARRLQFDYIQIDVGNSAQDRLAI